MAAGPGPHVAGRGSMALLREGVSAAVAALFSIQLRVLLRREWPFEIVFSGDVVPTIAQPQAVAANGPSTVDAFTVDNRKY